jgi:hypothetical protein
LPECAFHPGVETNVSCPECERYICPKDMVDTPVGYKCKECGRMGRPKLGGVKPRQLLLGAAAGLGAAIVGAIALSLVHFLGFLTAILYGALVGEATRRGAGGHRTWEFGAIAAAAAFVGAAIVAPFGGLQLLPMVLGPVVAALYVTNARWS